MNDKALREHIVMLLNGTGTRMSFDEAVADFPPSAMNTKFTNGDYSFWHVLEHMRLLQGDVLNFIVNPEYNGSNLGGEYWPKFDKKASGNDWEDTITGFRDDLEHLKKLTIDPQTDLFAKIKWGSGQTVLRELMVIADHNSYHIGEFAIMRQSLNVWGERNDI